MTYKSQQMKFQDISIGGEWFYRCRDKGTRLSNNLVKVTSRWKIWKSFYWILSLDLNLPPKMWESLEMPTPHKLRVCSGTTPVMHNWWSNKRIHFSSRCFVEETGSEIFWGIWKGCTDLPLDGGRTFQREHGRRNTSSLKPNVSSHCFKKAH